MAKNTSKWRRFKKAQELHSKIERFIAKNPEGSYKSFSALARKFIKKEKAVSDFSEKYVYDILTDWMRMTDNQRLGLHDENDDPVLDTNSRKGYETRDGYVINWTNNTIITDLGHWGDWVCTFSRHKNIQRKYVHAHGDETAAIVAMEFNFPHAKAVYKYAKIHGFTKTSVPQTDLEFEMGLTKEDAIEENLQTKKRRVYKGTQKELWRQTEKYAEKWMKFEASVMDALQNIEYQEYPKIKLPSIIKTRARERFAALIGISDVHYLKLCYDYMGNITYDRTIARKRLKDHTIKLAKETSRYGKPDHFYLIMGNDNIHVDGMHHSTTKLTTQHQATDGLWRLEFENYVQMQIDYVNYYKQIAPVKLIPVKGNHDYQMSIALMAFLSIHFRDDPMVEVLVNHDARCYTQYGETCIVATHGDELGSIPKLEREAHKLIMGEAKLQGINTMEVEHYILVHGHEHVGSYRDLNGHVQRIGLSSLSDIDDWWHKEKGFVGRQPESKVVIIQKKRGRKAILWA